MNIELNMKGDAIMLTVFGDSIMKRGIVERCGESLGIRTNNYARIDGTAAKCEEWVSRYEQRLGPDQIVLIEFGGNDSNYDWTAIAADPEGEHHPRTSIEDFKAAYTRIIQQVRKTGATPVVVSLPPIDAERYFRYFSHYWTDEERENVMQWLGGSTNHIVAGHEEYNRVIYRLSAEQGVHLIDITSELATDREYVNYLCEDGLHPNEKGQEKIAAIIARSLRQEVPGAA